MLPGPFWTPAIAASSEGAMERFGRFTVMGRPGQPERIAPASVVLAADGGSVTGALLEMGGGFTSAD